jgi:beta-fructofuranosidase
MDYLMDRREFIKKSILSGSAGIAVFNNTFPFIAEAADPDWSSKAPSFNFGETLAEQQAQLKDNPLLKRFAESRKKMADDPYRPVYHFVSPESTMNDPNGLCYWKGRWHLFYQGYPPEDPRQHWGHTVSDDLVHWKDLPYAIYPSPEKKCYSGAALVEEDRVIAMYHGVGAGNMIAVADDPLLLNWNKLDANPVIPIKKNTPYRVFDPCIWKKGKYYYSLSGGTKPGPGNKKVRANFLFRSKDLRKWYYLHPFVENDRFSLVGDDGACPYFWPIGDRHILLHFSHMSGGKYLLGDYDKSRDKFVVTSGGDFNFGPVWPGGVHAPSAYPDGNNGVIAIFNMNPGKRTEGWNQLMTLPRRLRLLDNDNLAVEPAGDIESLRLSCEEVSDLKLPANQEVELDNISGNTMEIETLIDVNDSPMVELNVLKSSDNKEFTRIMFFKGRGYKRDRKKPRPGVVSIDTSCSSILPDVRSRPPETAEIPMGVKEPLKLRVFIDKSILEVFVNGKQCLAVRVYPGKKDSKGVSLRSRGCSTMLKYLKAWQMDNIYSDQYS